MQAKTGQLIKTILPAFPEQVFDADSHILKQALENKAQQIAQKIGKYGSAKLTQVNPEELLALASTTAPTVPNLEIPAVDLELSAQQALFAKGMQDLALNEEVLSTAALSEKLSNVGISPEQINNMRGMSPSQLTAGLDITPQHLAALGINASAFASLIKLSPEQMQISANVSPEKLEAIGITQAQLSTLASASPEQVIAATEVSYEQLTDAAVTPEQLLIVANSKSAQAELLATQSSEQFNNVGANDETAQAETNANIESLNALINTQQSKTSLTTAETLVTGAAIPSLKMPKQNEKSSSDGTSKATPISILVQDQAGHPLCGQVYEVVLPDGRCIKGTTDEKGQAFLPALDTDECSITLPNLEADAW
ncbi:hypothetical protein [Glaciecola sp. 1036]|uniref:hypothetical protein n=1 Tax=Alteromonadaceae TaxID=72275 RepID=UPI003D08B2CD